MKMPENSLPVGWRWVKLREVCTFVGGMQPPKSTFSSYQKEGYIRLIQIQDYRTDQYKVYIREEDSDRRCTKDDIMIARYGGQNDTSSLFRILHGLEGAYNVALMKVVITVPQLLDTEYLYLALQRKDLRDEVISKSARAIQSGLTKADLDALEIPLPPLDEQRRIAAILNGQLAAVERARIAAEAQLEAASALPAAHLREVFESEEAGEWPRHKIGDVATSIQNGIYKPAEYYGHGYPMLRMYNIRNDTWALTLERLALVELDKTELETFGLRAGDLLVSRVNSFELVGKCAFVDVRVNGYVFENMLIRIRLTDTVDSLFIAYQMGNTAVRRQIEGVAKRAIGQSSINSTDVRNIEIALPSIAEQKRIAAMLKERMASVDRTRQALQAQLDGINQLSAVLLRKAFNGDL
jgi:type I restriction enzyme, S subunit